MTGVSWMREEGNGKVGALGQPEGMGWGGRWRRGFRMGGDSCIPVADSC